MSLLLGLTIFKTDDATITRPVPGARVDGEWIDGAPTVFAAVPVSIRPVNGKDLKTLPEGQTAENTKAIMCAFALASKDRVSGFVGDDGVPWEVFSVRAWNVMGARYTRALINRLALKV